MCHGERSCCERKEKPRGRGVTPPRHPKPGCSSASEPRGSSALAGKHRVAETVAELPEEHVLLTEKVTFSSQTASFSQGFAGNSREIGTETQSATAAGEPETCTLPAEICQEQLSGVCPSYVFSF